MKYLLPGNLSSLTMFMSLSTPTERDDCTSGRFVCDKSVMYRERAGRSACPPPGRLPSPASRKETTCMH